MTSIMNLEHLHPLTFIILLDSMHSSMEDSLLLRYLSIYHEPGAPPPTHIHNTAGQHAQFYGGQSPTQVSIYLS